MEFDLSLLQFVWRYKNKQKHCTEIKSTNCLDIIVTVAGGFGENACVDFDNAKAF